MSLLSLPDEILLNYIFSCDNITTTDLFRLMLSCRRLRNVIADSNQLWMSKCSSRWLEMHNRFHGKNKVVWKDWVFFQRLIEVVKNAVTNLSSQCYPLGKLGTPLHAVESWIVGYPNIIFAEDELRELIFTETISCNMTLSHYASVALERLVTCLQVRNVNNFLTKLESQKTLLEGAKLISKWFHFNDNGKNKIKKLVDNVEQSLDEMAERVRLLVKETNSEALKEILKCINKVLFYEMSFRVYHQGESDAWNHQAASIHKVIEERVGYPQVLCVIYLEVATRMGIACKPICIDCGFCSKNSILSCRVKCVVDVFYIGMCSRGFVELPSVHTTSIKQPSCSSEVFFGQMLESVVARDQKCLKRPDLCKTNLRSSVRLVCALWPVKVNVIHNANLCLEVDDGVEDAYRLLLSAEIDSNEPAMISCAQKLNSQQSQINEAKVARHRVPSINYAVGLVMIHFYKDAQGLRRQMYCVILSWDECFREAVSRRKWDISFEPVINGYRLNQPFYHIIPLRHTGQLEKNFYVPQETLQLHPAGVNHDWDMPLVDVLGIFFEVFDGRRYVPNAEHKAHFPDDNAVALSLIQQI